MAVTKLFGTNDLIKALSRLGLEPRKRRGTSHQIWFPTIKEKAKNGQRPFMTVVHKKGKYSRSICNKCLKQLMNLGYDIEEITEAFDC